MWQVFLPLCKFILTPSCPKSLNSSLTVLPPPRSLAAPGRGPRVPPLNAVGPVLPCPRQCPLLCSPPHLSGRHSSLGARVWSGAPPQPWFRGRSLAAPPPSSEMADRRCAKPRSHREGLGEAAAELGQLPSQTRGQAGRTGWRAVGVPPGSGGSQRERLPN